MTACIDYYVSLARYDWVVVDAVMAGQHPVCVREEDRAEVVRRVVAAEARRLIRLAGG